MSEEIAKIPCWVEKDATGAYGGIKYGSPYRNEETVNLSIFYSGSVYGVALQIGLPFGIDAAQFSIERAKILRDEIDKFIQKYGSDTEAKSEEEDKEGSEDSSI